MIITTNMGESETVEAEDFTAVERTMRRFDYGQEGLVEALLTAQQEYGYLSPELLTHVSDRLHVPLSHVYGVATFYDMFTQEAIGSTDCLVCMGPICKIAGGQDVLAEARKITGVSESGLSSADGTYSLREVSCLGLCDQAPAALVNMQAQVKLDPGKVSEMLRGMAQRPPAAPDSHASSRTCRRATGIARTAP